jgi:rod shape-determining protein MreC
MPLGTIDRTPPPFFRQGPSALTQLVVLSALAVLLMAADTRWQVTQPLRAAVATALAPLQRALLLPVRALQDGGSYLQGLDSAQRAEARARETLVAQAERAAQADALRLENQRLRALLELRPRLTVQSVTAEVLYEAPDPYSRKLLIDRGQAQAVVPGSPVINDAGVVGQVTRVFPLASEVTLIVDKDAAIPVVNTRTQARGAAYGVPGVGSAGALELRFMPASADVQVGDTLVTSGLDGVYPAGLPVARVTLVDRRGDSAFARVLLAPTAAPDGVRHLLVLQPLASQLPPWPSEPASGAASTPAAVRAHPREATP